MGAKVHEPGSQKVCIVNSHGAATVLGCELFRGDMSKLVEAMLNLIASGERHLVVTPNVDHVLRLGLDDRYRQAFERASLLPVDGMPVVALSRVVGVRGVVRNTGADLIREIARVAEQNHLRIAVVAKGGQTSERAVLALNEIAGAQVFQLVELPFVSDPGDKRSAGAVGQLQSIQPAVVFVCLGSPKQELWVTEWWEELPPSVYVGSGAALDFFGGALRRAPRWIQSTGFEWMWRLAQEPRRLARRYLLQGPRFAAVVIRSIIKEYS